jgi:hypothetical protein
MTTDDDGSRREESARASRGSESAGPAEHGDARRALLAKLTPALSDALELGDAVYADLLALITRVQADARSAELARRGVAVLPPTKQWGQR